uniref:Nucleotide-diphospho-sugar transferase domain-containing protein n=1 Tax=Calcidiscus leptoporus TaxID=127549 RepID=A0A7S0IPU1_9EUKA
MYSYTKADLLAVAPSRQILVSFTNRIRLDFANTWVSHVRAIGMSNYLIGATDDAALAGLKKMHIQCFSMRTNLPQGEWPWGSPSFKSLGPHKIELIYNALSWGFELVITDIDALVLREPFAYMSRWPDASFLTTSDHLGNTTRDGGLESHNAIHTAFNIGYMFFRTSALPLISEWRKVIAEQPRSRWDQGEFNRLARTGWSPRSTAGLSDARLFYSYKKEVIGGVLPLTLFCGGHNYFVSQLPQRAGVRPYSIHTTFQYGAAAGKRHRLREAMVWEDPPEYYNPPSGLLTFAIGVPAELVAPRGGMTTRGHIALVKHQLKQIRSALALAYALGRKLILPPVVCGYDKAWYALSSGSASRGVFPGAHAFALPLRNCPYDHFLEPASLRPVETVREYSFLSNPRTPSVVKESVSAVHVDEARGEAEVSRLRALTPKLLNVTNLAAVDVLRAGLLSGAQAAAFRAKFRYVAGSWCCAPSVDSKAGMPGSAFFNLLSA